MARIDPTRAPDAADQPRLPAQPSNQKPRGPMIPRSWAGLIVAFLLGALASGLITGAVVYSLNDDPQVVTRTVTVPAPDADPAGEPAGAAAAPCAETARLAQQQLDAVTAGLRQLGRLDTTGLQQTIDRLQNVQPDLQRAATACQTEATSP
ncbi:MAG TPA: hypothetical protein VF468_07010 [Actinomycetota bacterium]|nr:hypothetical protein [Actinomycetota bacterium]